MTTHRSDIFSNHRVRFVAARPTLALRPRARLPATIEGDAGAARSMETLLRARLDAQVARDRHRDRLRVIDADIRRAEEEGFAADAKVVSAREVLRRLERARDDARRRHAVLIARRKMANVTTRALAERDAARRTPRRRPNLPHPRRSRRRVPHLLHVKPSAATARNARVEPPAASRLRRCDATRGRLAPRDERRRSQPRRPQSPETHHAAPRPPEQLVCGSAAANPPPTTTATGGCATSLDARAVSAGDAGDGPAKGKRLDRLVKETWHCPAASAWRFGRRSSNCHRRRLIKPIKHIELS